MQFAVDPSIGKKIQAMQQRVRWQSAPVKEQGVDQTHLELQGESTQTDGFSFLVIGDSGTGKQGRYNPQYAIADQMKTQVQDARFVMHTGDVVYLVGSSEYYKANFIKPYAYLLKGGENTKAINYDNMVFSTPFFPVLGNHDYYDLPLVYGAIAGLTKKVRKAFPLGVDWDVAWHGSNQGEAYAKAFIDCLDQLGSDQSVTEHFDKHYVEHEIHPGQTAKCLEYKAGEFTRIPNRYYNFRVDNVDFYALDSNTFNMPPSDAERELTDKRRKELEEVLKEIESEKQAVRQSIEETRTSRKITNKDDREELDDDLEELRGELERLDEMRRDVEKQLNPSPDDIDWSQLNWLEEELVASWKNEAIRGRVLFFHHPPYVTEASKWHQGQTRAIRNNLRNVLDKVGAALGWQVGDRPLVDLVLNGHAHCLEHIETQDTGHGDAYTNWIVCGGSGYSLRRQRREGNDLRPEDASPDSPAIAKSNFFFGKEGRGREKKYPYSFLRVDVEAGTTPPKFTVRPFISERSHKKWHHYEAESFTIQSKGAIAEGEA
ncbi:MAG: hypothetical protein WBB82_17080 [Limnothrix sp.]